jgi:putative DNA primase/helicase
MTADQLLDRFEKVRALRQDCWQACCPAHEDRTPSLSIMLKPNGDWLLHCHAGCAVEDVLEAIKLEKRDLFAESSNGHREVVATYDYTDEQGELLFQVVRFAPKDFRQRRSDGVGGWEWKLGDTRRVLYRLPRVLEAVRRGEDIMVPEGEKDVEALEELGIAATCNPGGAGKWRGEYSEMLRGAKITVIADRDGPGREHARQVADSLRGAVKALNVVEPTRGKDIAAHLEAGGSIAELVEVPLSGEVSGVSRIGVDTDTPRYAGRRLDMAAILAEPDQPLPWRCRGVAADGYLTTIAGRGGEGKSWVTLALAHGVHAGRVVAGIPCTKGKAIMFDAENGAELIKRRFRAAGISAGSVQPYDVDGLHIVKDLDWFRSEVESEDANLVVFDSFRILSSGADENNTEEVEPIMSALRRLARETGAAIILVHHRGRDESSSYRGSSAIRDGTDLLFKLGRVKEDPEARHRRFLETVKCRIDEEPETSWLRIESDRTVGSVYVGEAEPYEGGTGGATVRAELAEELSELLDDEPRTMASLARELGRDPKDATVRRALKVLEEGGRARRTEDGWRGVSVSIARGVTPDTPDSRAESENGSQPELKEYAEAEIDRLRGKGWDL